jgi:putative SOS response-associated peptidase YedK
MCGRFYLDLTAEEIRTYFDAQPSEAVQERGEQLRFNIAPGQPILAVRAQPKLAGRSLDVLHWGLIPHFASDRKVGYRSINARAETIDRTPTFRTAFGRRRCLVVAHGFYEWRREGKQKQPFAIAREDDAPLALAGVWENWLDKSTGEWVRSVAIITTEANDSVRALHDRMPVILAPSDFALWLGEKPATPEQLKQLLVPTTAPLRLWPVSPRMNRPEVDDPEVLAEAPLPAQQSLLE